MATSFAFAAVFAGVGAFGIGTWSMVPIGVLVGVLASVEALKVHDTRGANTASGP